MYKVGMCGHFGLGYNLANGQTTKTKAVYNAIAESIGKENIAILDTYGWRKNPLKLILNCRKLLRDCENVIMLPARGGIKVFPRLFGTLNKKFNRKLHYVVIGGWLADKLKAEPNLVNPIKSLDCIYVELEQMQNDLQEIGLNNVFYMPNFRDKHILKEDELIYNAAEPYRVCTFSRVLKEKGIEEAIEAVRYVNSREGRRVYTLDIFGMIEPVYKERFEEIRQGFEPFISYKGTLDNEASTDELKNCFAMLFPTYYDGEGLAGTIIDAFSAGVPVIATDWKYNPSVITHLSDGIVYDHTKPELLGKILYEAAQNPQNLNEMKKNALKRAHAFESKQASKVLFDGLGISTESEAETI